MKKISLFLIFFIIFQCQLLSQNHIIPLWPKDIPNYIDSGEEESYPNRDILWIEKIQTPLIEVFLPAKRNATGHAVLICPGGGYHGLAYDWEGTDIAKWFNSKGIVGIVLKYRVPHSESVSIKHETPLLDAQRAMKLVRHHANNWNIDHKKVGIMGFSAGGHVASTLSTHFDQKIKAPIDSIDHLHCRPDFSVLVYPVITMKSAYTHNGSREALIGKKPSPEMIAKYSNELQITKDTPPAILIHSNDDKAVPFENSLLYFKALQKHQIYSEMHLYPYGGHGYSLAIGKGHLQSWPDRVYEWILSLDKQN